MPNKCRPREARIDAPLSMKRNYGACYIPVEGPEPPPSCKECVYDWWIQWVTCQPCE